MNRKKVRKKIQCTNCDNPADLKATKITHHYKECGLKFVTLIDMDEYRCEKCGETYLDLGNVDELHDNERKKRNESTEEKK